MRAEHLIALLLIDEERPVWTRAEIQTELADLPTREVGEALTSLLEEGVLVGVGESFEASRCAKRLNMLGMIGV